MRFAELAGPQTSGKPGAPARGFMLGVLALLVAWLSIVVTRRFGTASPLWPVNALALVAVLRWSRSRREDAVLLTSLALATAAANALGGSNAGVTVGFALLNAAEVYIAATLARRYATPPFRTTGQGWRFFFVAGPPGIALGACGAAVVTWLAGRPDPLIAGLTWFCADLLGFILVGPLGMTLSRAEVARLELGKNWRQALGMAALVLSVTAAAFLQSAMPLLFTVTPFVVLATFRFRLIGANAAMLLVACVAVPLTGLGLGPLTLIHLQVPGLKMLVLQAFLAMNGMTAVPLAAALSQRDHHLRKDQRRQGELSATNAALRVAARMAELAEDVAGAGHWSISLPSGEHHWSPGMYRIFGLPAADAPPPVAEVVGRYRQEDREAVQAALQTALDERTGCEWERQISRADGAVRQLRVKARFVEHEDQSGVLIGVARDVTKEIEAQHALGASERRYRLLAENATDVIACFGLDGRFSYLSPSVLRILGYAPEELIGRSTRLIMNPDDHRRSIELYSAFLAEGAPDGGFFFEYRAVRKDGESVWLSGHPCVLRDPMSGEVVGFQDVVREVTERKRLEANLAAALDEAQAGARAKSEFLANMSHELRTPLTSILGFTELLGEEVRAGPGAHYVARIREGGATLLATVNDILDFSKLEAGQIQCKPCAVDPTRLGRSVCALLQPQAKAKQLSLEVQAPVALPPAVWIDEGRLRQVLTNLVGNALKFTERGSVVLRLAHADGRLRAEVVDTGPGIPADRLNVLFQRFSQVDGSNTRSHGGTGLGLAISKGIMEAMGGCIGVQSEVGSGSVFWCEAPAPDVSASRLDGAKTGASAALAGMRILVVDETPVVRQLVHLLLIGVQAEVTEVESGEAALEQARTQPFDLIIMDVRAAGLGGVAAAKAIREQAGPNAAIPILAFTSETQVADFDLSVFDGVVSKPVQPARLFAALEAALTSPELISARAAGHG